MSLARHELAGHPSNTWRTTSEPCCDISLTEVMWSRCELAESISPRVGSLMRHYCVDRCSRPAGGRWDPAQDLSRHDSCSRPRAASRRSRRSTRHLCQFRHCAPLGHLTRLPILFAPLEQTRRARGCCVARGINQVSARPVRSLPVVPSTGGMTLVTRSRSVSEPSVKMRKSVKLTHPITKSPSSIK